MCLLCTYCLEAVLLLLSRLSRCLCNTVRGAGLVGCTAWVMPLTSPLFPPQVVLYKWQA